jgi:hypothetical protein
LFIIKDDSRTSREALDLEDGKLWKKPMIEERSALDKNEAWDVVELLTRRNPIGNKWVFDKKINV